MNRTRRRKDKEMSVVVKATRIGAYFALFGVLALTLMLTGCYSPRKDRLQTNLGYRQLHEQIAAETQELKKSYEERQGYEDIQPREVVLPEPEVPIFNPLDETLVSVSVQDETLHNVLFVVARNAGLNLVIEPGISLENRVTISFIETPSSLVIEKLLDAYDLAYAVEDNILMVRRFDSRLFALDFLDAENEVTIESGGDIFGSSGADSGSNELKGNFELETSVGGSEDSQNTYYGKLRKNIESIITGETQDEGGGGSGGSQAEVVYNGYYTVDTVAGTLFVETTPKRLERIATFVDELKRKLMRQVVIDAQIMEVQLDDSFNLGIDWSFVQQRLINGSLVQYGLGFDTNNGIGTPGGVEDSTQAIVLGGDTAGQGFESVFQSTVEALQTFGGVKVVSNPHVRARHGHPALMTSGTSIRYVSDIEREVDEGVTTFSTTTSTAFEGVMLGVVSFITDDDMVDLNIFPVTSEVDVSNVQTFADGSSVTLPVVDVRNVSTNVRVKNGDIVILGGLIYKESAKRDRGAPGLQGVPGLGWLFKNRADSEQVRELAIIMRIRVI